ncbi:MAG: Coenzyme F420 hydrogenase/dehydrogenase, beta subunit C-terminal domain [Nitrososphaerota archaeon]|nr:Coenzyme F420 hydrogenase/dehydrogenase, beta subunit C-terminal domain [Nitrososphaerales archaeon]MDW8044372.1 Coenzyme F420 hydrogenase/dehydrogenase, beta subunit C-terminal domain [Nitrososphaerota archaeon]
MTTVLKVRSFGSLISEVIKPGLCTGCGACVASCPILILTMKGDLPTIVDRCINCGICYAQCPQTNYSMEEFEKSLFGRVRRDDEPFGVYRSCFSARALNLDVRKGATHGGFVTALLLYMMDAGKIDGAILCSTSDSELWKAEPKVAVSREDIINSAGTKYTICPMILGLSRAVRELDKRNVAFVGTGHEIVAIRKSQLVKNEYWSLGDYVKLTIGLFCVERFSNRLIKEYIPSKGINPGEITKFHLTEDSFIIYSGDKVLLKTPIKELDPYVMPCCYKCSSSTADLADISAGGIGSEPGWTTVIIRSKRGEDLFNEALNAGYIEAKPLSQDGLNTIVEFSTSKRRSVKKGP